MSQQDAESGGQWAHGNHNVQIAHTGAGASISVTFAGHRRRVPLRPAIVPVGRAASPAQLMRASSGALPFVERADLLTGLRAWMAEAQAFSMYLVGGRGGSGKTRLGVQMCRIAQQQQWLCGLLEGAAEQGAVEALAQVPTARLVVIDYAESRAEQLAALLPALDQGASAAAPVRVLLLVRATPHGKDWSTPLRGRADALDALLNNTDQQVLDDDPLTLPERAELFTATAAAFTARAEPALPSTTPGPVPEPAPAPPPVLAEPVFATALMVVIAAYLAVHDAPGLPTTRQGLLDELAAHEDRYWCASSSTSLNLDADLRARIVALATLAGADSEDEASALLALLPDLKGPVAERRGRLARWVRDLYPGARWWNPLEPDLLGEHLVATHLAHYPGVLAGVLQRSDPGAVTQPLDLYARASADHPALAQALRPVLTTALPELCRTATAQVGAHTDLALLLGMTTLATALQRAVSVITVDLSTLPEALNALPLRSDVILGRLALTLTDQHVTALRALATADPATYEPHLASALNNLSVHLADAGQGPQALSASQEALSIRRRLAATNPAAYEPRLASSLDNLSVHLADAGQGPQALTAITEAVTIYRRLAATNPAAYEPDLASSLDNLSVHLADAGQGPQALSTSQEALSIRRRLAATDPAAYEPDLASSLDNLSVHLADAGQGPQALSTSQEAVTIYRRLAATNPAAHEPRLATSLYNLSVRLAMAGRDPQALSAIGQAVTIRRRLATANPAAYEPDLASLLNNLSVYLTAAGQKVEAEQAAQEALRLRRGRER